MSERLPPCPQEPDWHVAWEFYDQTYPWIRNLMDCPQDPIFHAEGNVWIHTRMVCEALASLSGWRALPEVERRVVFSGALLHDVAKPMCTREDINGRLTSRGHSRRGSIFAREFLWEAEVPFDLREQVASLVRYHQVPYYLLERNDAQRQLFEISQSVRCDHLALLAEADVRGRICSDQQGLLDNVHLFREFAQEQGCLSSPREFPSEHARFLYFRDAGRHPDVAPHEDFRCHVVLVAGLPGAGKDSWIRKHLPDWSIISLDAIRAELGISPSDEQGPVLDEARSRARRLLREKVPFVWNATNVSRQLRRGLIDLFADYHAHIRIVYVEVPRSRLMTQNRQREDVVPNKVLERLISRWEVPDSTEAHRVEYVIGS